MSAGPDSFTSYVGDNKGRTRPSNSVPIGGFGEGRTRQLFGQNWGHRFDNGPLSQVTESTKFEQQPTIQPLDPMHAGQWRYIPTKF